MPSLNEIAPTQLMRQLGGPDTLTLLDVRTDEDFAAAPLLLPTSRRLPHTDVGNHLATFSDTKVVVICHKGKKLSHGTAALLRASGIAAEVLDGGFVAWQAATLPLIPAQQIPPPGTLWVTRHRPRIDRIACPWLIRRFVDPTARFLFVPPSEVLDVADRFNAIAFDTPGAPWTHNGPNCTFDALIDGFSLGHDALNRLASVVRAADTDTLDQSPQAAGLLAFSVGLSRLYKEDQNQLTAGLPLYDALYRWARDGHGETHDHARVI
ncbi:chromate resistance protein ChrB domain-containing protein [Shimia abyssi]|uniref:Rhodanese domain-containing protein n=1 Tax=Shimia abyssi TaxID=1662395 RepID=A0A2P8F6E3_9RHOB|nr:chromate resistance protein ChrB domain-containing protein [Shimia abyssi]PSL17275.1 hypothetical protein CLV88_11946 [Shimia abyssi]